MVNPRAPQFVRVGKTTRPPEDTAQEANLQLRDAAYFSDCLQAEGFCHDYLETFHSSDDPEMFEVPVEIALQALSLAMEKHIGTRANLPANPSIYDEDQQVGDGTTATSLYEEDAKLRANQNPQEAIRYFKRAARLAEPRAFLSLAEMYERGEGCQPDPARAIEWLNEGTRAGARECWGALADRVPQVKHLRPYFTGMDVPALSPEQRSNAVRRMRLYLQLAAKGVEADDAKVIGPVVAQLKERDLTRQWREVASRARQGGSPALKWGLALAIAGGIGVMIPLAMHRMNSGVPQDSKPAETGAAEATAPAPDQPAEAPGKSKQKNAVAKANRSTTSKSETPAPAAPSRPVINDGKPAAETQSAAPVETAVIRTPPPVQEAAPARAISSNELKEQFYWSKEKASAAFKDSLVKITDQVAKVGKHDISFNKIKCKFDGDPPARVQPGMTVTVEGTVQGKARFTGTIQLEHCRVLP